MEIKVLRRQGRSIRQLMRETGLSRNTVRKYLRGSGEAQYGPRQPRPCKLDLYKDYLLERIEQARPEWIPATVLLREIRERGYQGGISQLKAKQTDLKDTKALATKEHSANREVVLQVTLEGKVVDASRYLRPIIERLFNDGLPCSDIQVLPWRENAKDLVMRVEGLTIDGDGWVYIGFRAPLVNDRHALVLRTRLKELFENEPKFEAFQLRLHEREKYGIVSLDYDANARKIVVMGNHPESMKQLPPKIWTAPRCRNRHH